MTNKDRASKHPEDEEAAEKVGKTAFSLPKELQEELTFGANLSTSKPLALVIWEDITAYSRVEIPEDFEEFRLIKKTAGIIWTETPEYLVLVQDYDQTNRGKNFRHNDFHIIPKGVIREVKYLGTEEI